MHPAPAIKSILKNVSCEDPRSAASGYATHADDTDEDYWLTNNHNMLTQPLPTKGNFITAQAGILALMRGRPACLPPWSRSDRGLREQPGCEEQRDQLKGLKLPQGSEPGMPANQGTSRPAPAATESSGELQQQQFYHAMHTAIQHAHPNPFDYYYGQWGWGAAAPSSMDCSPTAISAGVTYKRDHALGRGRQATVDDVGLTSGWSVDTSSPAHQALHRYIFVWGPYL